MICFVIWGKYLCLLTKNNIFEKMYDILVILIDFVDIFRDFGWFFATRIRLTKVKRIQTDPDPKHWFKQYINRGGGAVLHGN